MLVMLRLSPSKPASGSALCSFSSRVSFSFSGFHIFLFLLPSDDSARQKLTWLRLSALSKLDFNRPLRTLSSTPLFSDLLLVALSFSPRSPFREDYLLPDPNDAQAPTESILSFVLVSTKPGL